MPRLRIKRSSKRRPRPPSPLSIGAGIPGDYFECNEQQLVQKLDTLRRGSNPFIIPSLLDISQSMDSASLNTTEDDPDLFFKEWEEEEHLKLNLAKMHLVSSADNDDDAGQEVVYSDFNNNISSSNHDDAMERLDGEQLSVHSPDDGSLAEERNDYQQLHQKQQKQPSKSKSKRGLLQRIGLGLSPKNNNNTNKSSKSWEGSEIVLDANSFIIDPSLLEKVQQETNFGKGVSFNAGSGIGAGIGVSSFHLVGSGSKKGALEERSDASPRTITKLIFDQESESESSPLSQSKSLSKKKKHVPVIPATSFSSSLDKSNSMDSDQENLHHDRARGTIKPLHAPSQSLPQSRPHPQTAFARRWSFSSSVADEEEEQDEIHPNSLPYFAKSKSFSHRHHQHHRHRPGSAASSATATTRSSNPDYTSLDANQELFLKLSEDDDLRDFKHINNFSFEGDYLLSRILRERMRIQLKRDMLTTPDSKDLYVETHKRLSRSEMEVADDLMQERSVYFMI